jgi:hypothetical protein
MVLLEGIELSTSPLPRECSTTELQQRSACFLWITANAVNPDCKTCIRTAAVYATSALRRGGWVEQVAKVIVAGILAIPNQLVQLERPWPCSKYR